MFLCLYCLIKKRKKELCKLEMAALEHIYKDNLRIGARSQESIFLFLYVLFLLLPLLCLSVSSQQSKLLYS